jgi:hypothetical protein
LTKTTAMMPAATEHAMVISVFLFILASSWLIVFDCRPSSYAIQK